MEQYNFQEKKNTSVMVKRRISEDEKKEMTLYLQVISSRKVRQVKLPYRVYAEEWNKQQGQVIVSPDMSAERQAYLLGVAAKLKEDCNDLWEVICRLQAQEKPFTVDDIVQAFKKSRVVVCLNAYLEKQIAAFTSRGCEASARHCYSLKTSFSEFLNGEDIPLQWIDEERVVQYEAWLISKGLKANTVSFYLRGLRAIWNRAVREGLIKVQPSPFCNVNTRIEKTEKKAVSEEVIRKIEKLAGGHLADDLSLAAQLFLFCYYAQGMAFIDLTHLTTAHIQGDYLVYARHKTGEKVWVKLLPVMKAILRRFQSSGQPFLFPILSEADTSYRKYESVLRIYNSQLMRLGKQVGAKLSSYVPRHSWATNAKNRGVSEYLISEGMGHTSLKTTLIYIDTKNNEKIDKMNEWLIMGKGKIYKGSQETLF